MVPADSDVTFNYSGSSSSGITFTPNSSTITITTPGTYLVRYSVTSVDVNQFALMVDGSVVPQTIYGVGNTENQNTGEALITIPSTASSTNPSTITLRNHSSYGTVELFSNTGGTQPNINASIFIQQI